MNGSSSVSPLRPVAEPATATAKKTAGSVGPGGVV
jgi:hypothetical protein